MSLSAASTTLPSPLAFELSDERIPDGANLLGIWRESTATARPGTEPREADLPVWRAELPADPSAAMARLTGSATRMGASVQGLVVASARLDATLQGDGTAFAFSAGERSTPGGPEAELTSWLLQAEGGGAGLAFGPDRDPAWWEATSHALMRFSGRVARWCTPWSRVETVSGGRQAGLSLIGLGGDVHTVLDREIGTRDAAVHERVVALAVTSRATLFRILGIVGRGATSIGSRLAMPGGQLLALPAVWRFVNEVITEAARPARG